MRPRMLNHAAFVARDAAQTVDFYTRVMGMELVAGLVDDTVPSTGDPFPYFHLFFGLRDGSCLAFFVAPGLPDPPEVHPAYAIFNHFAFHCDTQEELLQWKQRLLDNGVEVLGPIDHNGEMMSIYFHDPNDLRLEFSWMQVDTFFDNAEGAKRVLADWSAVVDAATANGHDVAQALVEHIRATRSRVVHR